MLPIYSGITPEIEQFLKILQQKGSNKTLDKKKKISYGKVNFFFFWFTTSSHSLSIFSMSCRFGNSILVPSKPYILLSIKMNVIKTDVWQAVELQNYIILFLSSSFFFFFPFFCLCVCVCTYGTDILIIYGKEKMNVDVFSQFS